MNLRFAPAALALALSATSVALSNNVDADGAGALLADRLAGGADDDDDGKSAATIRRAERMFPLDADGVAGALSELDAADAGILGSRRLNGNKLLFGGTGGLVAHRRGRRSLQDGGEVTCIKPDTCEPNLCKCTANGGLAYDCAAELHALCNNVTAADGTVFTISGCVDYTDYFYNLICPFAKCVVEGGTNMECGCKFYNMSCAIYDTQSDKYDEVHIQHCEADLCCMDKMDDAGRASCFEGAPTSNPSNAPSGQTTSPTSISIRPSARPLASPSARPSSSPTVSPTARPTASPPVSPSTAPSASPLAALSASPLAAPSVTSPIEPSVTSPTVSPTARPTASLTSYLSAAPSASPLAALSATPLAAPSVTSPTEPSVTSPTVSPTTRPTASLSSYLSAAPSASHLAAPSVTPLAALSVTSLTEPSVNHSVEPSTIPSLLPSVASSSTHSVETSSQPSREHHSSVEPTNTSSTSPTRNNSTVSMGQFTDSPLASPTASLTTASPVRFVTDSPIIIALTVGGIIFAFVVLFVTYRVMKQRRKKREGRIIELASPVEPNLTPQVQRGVIVTTSEEPNFPIESTEQPLFSIDVGGLSVIPTNSPPAGEQHSSNFDAVEDLIKDDAAMAIDIEPENPDVESAMSGSGTIAMSGIGSGGDSPNNDNPQYDAAIAIDIEPENPNVERAMSGSGTFAMSGIGSGGDSHSNDNPQYDAAMAIDIEPENPDIERAMSGSETIAMSGTGSGGDSPNSDKPQPPQGQTARPLWWSFLDG
ncbi:hypothetical protein ACHAW5_002969 [Stephanodiscus triporus]|uniref:Circumsporozoite protein n=1 Tax=Stephanodiscus triporus TaxID=2934178 RepID=A0ABD3PGF2_9STRA